MTVKGGSRQGKAERGLQISDSYGEPPQNKPSWAEPARSFQPKSCSVTKWGCPETGRTLKELTAGDCHPTSVSTTHTLLLLPLWHLGNLPSVSTLSDGSPPCVPLQIQWVLCDFSLPRNFVAFIGDDSFPLSLLSEVSALDFHDNFLST